VKRQADLIKIAAVITAAPRWVGALMAAEGFTLPSSWLAWWIPLSAILSAGMALVEGLAFAFVFNAWRKTSGRPGTRLLALALLSALTFIIVLSPFIAAQVRQESLVSVLSTGWALWLWSASVAASTIVIVASVGYAQRTATTTQLPKPRAKAPRNDAQPTPQRTATIADWRAIYPQLDGKRATLTANDARAAVNKAGFAPPSERTLVNWAKEARDGCSETGS